MGIHHQGKPQLRDDPVPLLRPMDWVPRAACRDRAPELFDEFPRTAYLSDFTRLADAQAICADCPVRRQCLEFGAAHRTSGIYGGFLLVAGRPVDGPGLERRRRAAGRRHNAAARYAQRHPAA